MEILRFTLGASETKIFERAGAYFELLAVGSTVNVRLLGAYGERGESMLGVEVGTWAKRKYSGVEVTNPTATAQSIAIMVTDGEAGSNKIPGLINAQIDTATVSNLGKRFIGYGYANGTADDGVIIDSSTGTAFAVHQIHVQTTGTRVDLCTATSIGGSWAPSSLIPDPGETFDNMVVGGAAAANARKRFGPTITNVVGRKVIGHIGPLDAVAVPGYVIWRPTVPFIISGTNALLLGLNSGAGAFTALIEIEEF